MEAKNDLPYQFSYQKDRMVRATKEWIHNAVPDSVFYLPSTDVPKAEEPVVHRSVAVVYHTAVHLFKTRTDASRYLAHRDGVSLSFYGIRNRLKRARPRSAVRIGRYTAYVIMSIIHGSERWKDIADYPDYQVSNRGRVRSKAKIAYRGAQHVHLSPRLLRQSYSGQGYLRVTLHHDTHRRSYSVSYLVARAFIPNPRHYPKTCHIDSQHLNNNADNLKWCTQAYIVHYGLRTQHTFRPVALIKGTHVWKFVSMLEAARWLRKHGYSDRTPKSIRGYLSMCLKGGSLRRRIYGFAVIRI